MYESKTLMLMNLCVKTRGLRLVTKSKLTSRALGPGTRVPGPVPRSLGPWPLGPGLRALGNVGIRAENGDNLLLVAMLRFHHHYIIIYVCRCVIIMA